MPHTAGAPPDGALLDFLRQEAARPAPPEIQTAALALAARYRGAVSAILFYGSCRRTGEYRDGIVDLYLLVDSYRATYRNPLTASANRLLPPNVSYAEIPIDGGVVRFKFGIVSVPEFVRRAGPATLHPAIWGRFAQPTSLLWARDAATAERVLAALATSGQTLLGATLPLMPERFSAEAIWARALSESYGSELRAEQPGVGARLYQADAAFYDAVAAAILPPAPDASGLFVNPATSPEARARAQAAWRRRGRIGKPLSLARLVKAAFTFGGGVDYLLWKIARHSGVTIEATPWQRRHPLLSGPLLAWKLYRRGGFR